MPKWTDFGLRKINNNDLSLILEWRNSERIRKNMYTEHIISWEEHKAWYERLQEVMEDIYLVFEYKNIPIGLVYFTDIDNYNGTSFWGFYIGDCSAPRVSGAIMGFLGAEYAFSKINIRKLCGETFASNEGGKNFHIRLGFKEEGYFVKHVFKKEKYENVFRFALFSDEWHEKREYIKEIISKKVIEDK